VTSLYGGEGVALGHSIQGPGGDTLRKVEIFRTLRRTISWKGGESGDGICRLINK